MSKDYQCVIYQPKNDWAYSLFISSDPERLPPDGSWCVVNDLDAFKVMIEKFGVTKIISFADTELKTGCLKHIEGVEPQPTIEGV
jgi:hypothetical protein